MDTGQGIGSIYGPACAVGGDVSAHWETVFAGPASGHDGPTTMIGRRVPSLACLAGSQRFPSIYSADKAICRIFAEGLWLEMQDYNVDVLELVLGLTRTPAMDRAGLKMDTPGLLISEPRDVAAQGLANIANGPVVVKQFESAAEKNSGHNRAELLLEARAAAKKLLPPPSA
ncbi:SDR family oxidoreductase [Nocardia grenadensis]|uniref:hypothetical protein n=1 Tax=Nocardia grenadensis TaxID=931537 RepID=UPI003D75C06B